MRIPTRSARYAASRRPADPADNELGERALLEEFNRSDSVVALAGAICARIGREARPNELIAQAGLVDRILGRRARVSAMAAKRSGDTMR